MAWIWQTRPGTQWWVPVPLLTLGVAWASAWPSCTASLSIKWETGCVLVAELWWSFIESQYSGVAYAGTPKPSLSTSKCYCHDWDFTESALLSLFHVTCHATKKTWANLIDFSNSMFLYKIRRGCKSKMWQGNTVPPYESTALIAGWWTAKPVF